MFEATGSFAFFDYFRIPYRIVPAPSTLPHRNGSYGLLWRAGTDGPLLAWPLADVTPRARGSFRLRGKPIFGRMVNDRAAARLRSDWGSHWRAVESILDGRGRDSREVCLLKPFGPPRLAAAVNGLLGRSCR